MQGMIGLGNERYGGRCTVFFTFSGEENKAVTNPVWQEMLKESDLVSEHILSDDKSNSLEKDMGIRSELQKRP